MKKFIYILVFIISILLVFSNLSSDEKMLKNFADDVINENITIEQVIKKYIICDLST